MDIGLIKMENKILLKEYLKKIALTLTLFLISFLLIQKGMYQIYIVHTNQKISAILEKVIEKYPNVSKNELMELLNTETIKSSLANDYGIDINKESYLSENDRQFFWNILLNILFFIVLIGILGKLFLDYQKKKDRELQSITMLIKQINQKNYELHIDTMSEDELSILKNEIYKTTLLLKEEAETSKKDKLELKNSLSDISHQLKTPLTSILILLDNMIDNPNMEVKVRDEFIHDIKREIMNIKFLVESILKLAQLDSNTVTFMNQPILVSKIIEKATENIQPLCDLKNISIEVYSDKNSCIVSDFKWQVEAITNILKNSVEHSFQNTKIIVRVVNTPLYVRIYIENTGNPIEKQDLPHIFERFYKGINAREDSIGIGLSLSKKIIESASGTVYATSNNGKTEFQITYFI